MPLDQQTKTPQTTFIIVNWNLRERLEKCLYSLAQQTLKDFEVVLVDNGSTDGSIECVEQFPLPCLTIVRNKKNVGFSPAVNQGIEVARGQFIALINNDVELDPRWLEEILRGFKLAPRVGMCASKILLADDRRTIDKVGHQICGDGQAYGRGHQEEDCGQYDELEEVLWPDGAAAMYRAEVFAEIGTLDEDFFAYCDDAELGLRARFCGWKCFYIPTALAYHHHSATLGAYSPEKIFLVERNRIWLVIKLFPMRRLVLVPFYSAIRYMVSLWALFTKRGPVSRAANEGSVAELLWTVVRAQVAALAGVPRMLAKRRAFRKLRRIPLSESVRLLKRYSITARRMSFHN